MRWAAAFSSSPVAPRLGFSRPSSSATIHTIVQSLMDPSHNDPLNHMPAPLSCNFGAPQPRQQRWSSFGTRGNFAPQQPCSWQLREQLRCSLQPASNLGTPGQPRQQLSVLLVNLASNCWYSRSTSPATSALPVNWQPRQQLRSSQQPRQQLQRSQATSPATCALLINLASDFGTPWPLSFCEPLNCFLVHNL